MSSHDILENVYLKSLTVQKKFLNNRYTLGKKIAEGGLSEVYAVKDSYSEFFQDDKNLVVKIPSSTLSKKKDVAAFIYSEYSILSSLQHDNIVRVFDFGIDELSKTPCIIMQKLEGKLLSKLSLKSMSYAVKTNLISSIFDAVKYLHSKNIVHADINPSNIMVSKEGIATLFDFGISQNTEKSKSFNLAFDNVKAYNPMYTAPEILKGTNPSKQSDIFSLACLSFEIHTGKLPFKKSSSELQKKPIEITHLSKIPPENLNWFKRALSYDPLERQLEIQYL